MRQLTDEELAEEIAEERGALEDLAAELSERAEEILRECGGQVARTRAQFARTAFLNVSWAVDAMRSAGEMLRAGVVEEEAEAEGRG